MRKILVIISLSTYLLSTTEIGQLLKMPILISHFAEHKENDNRTTLWTYLVHHYEGHEKDDDWETDMKLPFMQCSDLLKIMVITSDNFVNLPKDLHSSEAGSEGTFYREPSIPPTMAGSIWQPPKSC